MVHVRRQIWPVALMMIAGSAAESRGQSPAFSVAREITDPADLIQGQLSRGRLGDFLLANDQIQVVIQKPGRVMFGIGTYGGNIIDADLQRNGAPERDSFEELVPGINIENTPNYTQVTVVNDGSNGPAVVRATGPDDLFDFVNGSSAIRGMGLMFPASADDRDLPLDVQTDYTLEQGKRYVKIDTTLTNTGAELLDIYFVEYINGSGQIEMWHPAYGFGEPLATTTCPPSSYQPCSSGACDPCNFIAFSGEDGAAGVSYGYIHNYNRTTAVTISGVTVPALGQEVVAVFVGAHTPNFHMNPAGLPGSSITVTRWFAVGDGSVGSIAEIRNEILGFTTGTLSGTVTSGGNPLANADVAVIGQPQDGPAGIQKNVVDHFRTAADGTYGGSLPPGRYTVQVNKDHRCFDASCSASPMPAEVTIVAGMTTTQDFSLPGVGRLRVTVRDQNGRPIPAKVQLVGFDPSRDPKNVQDVQRPDNGESILRNETGVFGAEVPEVDGLVFGIAFAGFVPRTGTRTFNVEPGDYQLVVSRGPRYSAFKRRVTITEGTTTAVTARIAQVVRTAGFIAADFHVHAIDSPDSEVTKQERIATMLAEGIDFFTPSDHDFRADFAPTIAAMGVSDLISTAPSAEITTFDYGHFNSWPVTIDPTKIHGGGIDWGREGILPGMDFPSLGSFNLSPKEIFDAAHAEPPNNLIQINHVRSFFGRDGLDIDTAEGGTGPPQSHTDPATRRLDPAIQNFFDDGFDALEVWIGTDGRTGDLQHFLGENLGDWFNLLNQGIVKAGVADSDTHSRRITNINARTYVASKVADPGQLVAAAADLAANVSAGKATGTNAPFVRVTAFAPSTGQSAGLGARRETLLSTTDGAVDLTVSVTSPAWAQFDKIQLFVNNAPQPYDDDGDSGTRDRYRVIPDVEMSAGTDFAVTKVDKFPGIPAAKVLQASTTVELRNLTEDVWVVVVARGTDGVSRPLFPVLPNSLRQSSNATLDDLTDGNLGEDGVLALAFTNPFYVDTDGDGEWTAPGVRLTPK